MKYLILISAMFCTLFLAKQAHSGEGFDELGYMHARLAENVIRDNGIAATVARIGARATACKYYPRCISLTVTGDLEKRPDSMWKLVVAMSQPCVYSTSHTVAIKNPDLAAAKIIPNLDGKTIFCTRLSGDYAVVISFSDTTGTLGREPLNLVIFRNPKTD